MKNWNESEKLFSEIARRAVAGEACALATVIQIDGSTYRRPGAKLLIGAEGALNGNVSGGCLENDVKEIALQLMKEGKSRRVHYDTSGPEDTVWGFGLGCNGKIDLDVRPCAGPFLEIVGPVLEQLRGDRPFALVSLLAGDPSAARFMALTEDGVAASGFQGAQGQQAESMAASALAKMESGLAVLPDGQTVFIEVLKPPARLVICGAGDDARPIVEAASTVGFRVTVVDHRSAYLAKDRFPSAHSLVQARPGDALPGVPMEANTFVVIKTHGLTLDQGWFRQCMETRVRYIGLMGPRTRRAEILKDIPAGDLERVYGPVGLDIGAEGSEQIAISIVSELLAVNNRRAPGHLRDRQKPIHEG